MIGRITKTISAVCLICLLVACSDNPNPSLWNPQLGDPNYDSAPQPVIQNFIPADSSLAGAGTITIEGTNFSPTPENNFVYFDKVQAEVVSASENSLTVKSPDVPKDTIKVKIGVFGGQLFSDVKYYKLKPAVQVYATPATADKVYNAIAVDDDGTVYVYVKSKTFIKVTAKGTIVTINDGKMTFDEAQSMKFGPGGKLYAAFAAGRNRVLYTIDKETGASELFKSVSANPRDFDFDSFGNIWVGTDSSQTSGSNIIPAGNISWISADGTTVKIARSAGTPVKSVRVFNNFLYYSLLYPEATSDPVLYKSQINNDGTLGEAIALTGPANSITLSTAQVSSITFAEDGVMYITVLKADNAFFEYNENGDVLNEKYPGLIAPEIVAMYWGNSTYLYLSQQPFSGVSKILKANLLKNTAPYLGSN